MNAELTAEKRPACRPSGSVLITEYRNRRTDEDKGRIQVLVILFRVISIKLSRFPAVDCEEVCPGVIGPQRVEEFLEGGMEARMWYQQPPGCRGNRMD